MIFTLSKKCIAGICKVEVRQHIAQGNLQGTNIVITHPPYIDVHAHTEAHCLKLITKQCY